MKNEKHGEFKGSIQGFHHFIGPRIKNRICDFTRSKRNSKNGICEFCNSNNNQLDSAHVHGKGRRQIIESVLKKYLNNKTVIIPSLEIVEKEILESHIPIQNVIKFLCKKCHNEYDNTIKNEKTEKQEEIPTQDFIEADIIKKQIEKVENRIPGWFQRPNQKNSKILIRFLKLLGKNNFVSFNSLNMKCLDIDGFIGHFNQMSNFGENNHGKVFEKIGESVILWDNVKEFIIDEYIKCLNIKPAKNIVTLKNSTLAPTEVKNNFIVTKSLIGQGKVIKVKFKRGKYINKTYIYDHDKLVEACSKYLNNSKTWNYVGNWTCSSNIPGWAMDSGLVKVI